MVFPFIRHNLFHFLNFRLCTFICTAYYSLASKENTTWRIHVFNYAQETNVFSSYASELETRKPRITRNIARNNGMWAVAIYAST